MLSPAAGGCCEGKRRQYLYEGSCEKQEVLG